MLFWLFVIILLVGIALIVVGNIGWDSKKHSFLYYNDETIDTIGKVVSFISGAVLAVMVVVLCCSYIDADAKIAQNNEIYESLVYQLENNLYDNDNDLGKKELYNEIREWNADLAYYQNVQDDFWLGIFYPNVFDQFEFINLE